MIRRARDGRTFFVMDCHVHVGHTSWLERFRGKQGGFLGSAVVEHLDHYGQDIVVGFPTADVTTDYGDATDLILDVARQYPTRIVPFTRINPNFEKTAAASLADRVARGARGIKFHPHMDAYPANDERIVRPVMEEANRLGLVVLIHSGESWFSAPGLIFDLAQDYKDIKFIIGHSGLYGYHHEAMVMARKADNIWLDTTEIYPASVIGEMVRKVGKEKVVFGTDSPYLNCAAELEKVLRFNDLADDELDAVLGRNLAGMFGIDPDLTQYAQNTVDYPIETVFW